MQENDEEQEFVDLPLLKVSEAAKYLGVGRQVLYNLIDRGEIRVVKADKTMYVEKTSLDEFRESGKLT